MIGCREHIQPINLVSHEEYAIYTSIINQLSSSYSRQIAFVRDSTLFNRPPREKSNSGSNKILVYKDSGPGKYIDKFSNSVRQNWQVIDLDYYQRILEINNGTSYCLILDSMHTFIPIQRLNKDSVSLKMFDNVEPLLFWFSRVAFNPQNDEAIVYIEYVCGSVCGAGEWYWLKKSQGLWKIFKSDHTWIS